MSGKFFVGNTSNIATLPKNILVGNPDNIAKNVKGIYVGNSQNQAVKVWPNKVVPDAYTQIEWYYLRVISGPDGWLNPLTLNIPVSSQPRFVISFQVVSKDSGEGGYLFDGMINNKSIYTSAFDVQASSNRMLLSYDSPDGETFHITTNSFAGIDTSFIYTIDYNNMENHVSRFYLYSNDGYYSIPSNNLLGTIESRDYSGQSAYYTFSGKYTTPSRANITFIKIFSFKVYDNSSGTSGDLIHDYYPCYQNSGSYYIGYYDIIDKIFYHLNCPYNYRFVALGPIVG